MSQTVTPYLEMSRAIMDAGGEALKKCYQCGTCTGTCPWTPITHFNIRKLVRFGQLGLDGIEEYHVGMLHLQILRGPLSPGRGTDRRRYGYP